MNLDFTNKGRGCSCPGLPVVVRWVISGCVVWAVLTATYAIYSGSLADWQVPFLTTDGYILLPQMSHRNETEETLASGRKLSDDITMVTAFLDMGVFHKSGKARSSANYSKWMEAFAYLENPLIAYLDADDNMVETFQKIRNRIAAKTAIRRINKSDLWTFSIVDDVAQIFKNPHYPKFLPNTVYPEYACLTSAKFEVMNMATKENPFNTQYIAWVDFGYIRSNITEVYSYELPPVFDQSKVAFTLITDRNVTLTPRQIIRGNKNWVAGGFFMANISPMRELTTAYLNNLSYYLSKGLFISEQPMLYAMRNDDTAPSKLPDIQLYNARRMRGFGIQIHCFRWIFLGCLSNTLYPYETK